MQLKLGLVLLITAPAAMLQLEPPALEAMLTTVRPPSAGEGKVKVSLSVTAAAVDGPLLRKDST